MKISDIKKAADKKYKPLVIDFEDETSATLRLPIRLKREEREAITKAFEADDDTDKKDMLDIYSDVFRIVIEEDGAADKLFEAFGEDLSLYQELFGEFAERMQPGEAGSSKK